MDNEQLLQYFRDLPLEEGRIFLQEHLDEISDYIALGKLIFDEAQRQRNANPALSLKLAELLIFWGEQRSHTVSHALGLRAKGNVLNYMGHHQAALACLNTAGEEFRSLGDEINWAWSRMSWILACAWLGQIEAALEEAARAREVFLRHDEHYWVCAVNINTAVIYTQSGQYQKALDLYEKILPVYPTLPGQNETFIKGSIGMIKNNQARNLSWLGNFEQAYRLMQEAQAIFVDLEEPSRIVTVETNLAEFDYAQGYYGSALRHYYQARDTFQQNNLDDPLALALMMLQMAVCLGETE